ncbi:MAG: hypothetical protein AVDCRST_MAG11-1202, partial [uncultured Gemmatimonadaceae bacterium]
EHAPRSGRTAPCYLTFQSELRNEESLFRIRSTRGRRDRRLRRGRRSDHRRARAAGAGAVLQRVARLAVVARSRVRRQGGERVHVPPRGLPRPLGRLPGGERGHAPTPGLPAAEQRHGRHRAGGRARHDVHARSRPPLHDHAGRQRPRRSRHGGVGARRRVRGHAPRHAARRQHLHPRLQRDPDRRPGDGHDRAAHGGGGHRRDGRDAGQRRPARALRVRHGAGAPRDRHVGVLPVHGHVRCDDDREQLPDDDESGARCGYRLGRRRPVRRGGNVAGADAAGRRAGGGLGPLRVHHAGGGRVGDRHADRGARSRPRAGAARAV